MRLAQRPHFDRAAEFVARRSLTIAGQEFNPGDKINPALTQENTLRLLYENRKIDQISDGQKREIGGKIEGTSRYWRPEYQAEANYVARRKITIGGVTYFPGDVIDTRLANDDRVIRQLYENRKIEQVAPVMVPKEALDPSTESKVVQNIPNRRDALAKRYEELTGKKADGRWRIETLKAKIEKALD